MSSLAGAEAWKHEGELRRSRTVSFIGHPA
jgi:hypothetical protein